MYSKSKLENYWSVEFRIINDCIVELLIPCFKSKYYEIVRVVKQNKTEFVVARKAKGSFNNGYDYRMHGKIYGFGYKKIKHAIKNSSGMDYIKYNERFGETYIDIWASAINEARKMLKDN